MSSALCLLLYKLSHDGYGLYKGDSVGRLPQWVIFLAYCARNTEQKPIRFSSDKSLIEIEIKNVMMWCFYPYLNLGHDSRMAQARHYRHLQEMCRKNKQNQDDISQLLELEFEGRRQFIDSETLKEAFKNIDHVSTLTTQN